MLYTLQYLKYLQFDKFKLEPVAVTVPNATQSSRSTLLKYLLLVTFILYNSVECISTLVNFVAFDNIQELGFKLLKLSNFLIWEAYGIRISWSVEVVEV